MRLIDADALIERIDDEIRKAIEREEIYGYMEDDRTRLIAWLQTQPTAIGECKDCKSADFIYEGDVHMCYCLEHGRPMCSDDFCIYFCQEVQ